MAISDCWARNGEVRLHYLSSASAAAPTLAPLVLVPGAFGVAEQFREEMPLHWPRRCVAVSLRGRGQSDAPEQGYSLADHATDLDAVVRDAHLEEYCLLAQSFGVPVALSHALSRPGAVKAMVLCDYAARYVTVPPEWVDRVLSSVPPVNAQPHVVRGLQRDSSAIELWERLDRLECPILIIRGGAGGLLSQEHIDLYLRHLRDARVIVFEDSGHDVRKPDYGRYMATVKDFLGAAG
jgi:pimeloyl-ACP methyl ester carboxylesterase